MPAVSPFHPNPDQISLSRLYFLPYSYARLSLFTPLARPITSLRPYTHLSLQLAKPENRKVETVTLITCMTSHDITPGLVIKLVPIRPETTTDQMITLIAENGAKTTGNEIQSKVPQVADTECIVAGSLVANG